MKNLTSLTLIISLLILACTNPNPNLDTQGKDELKALEVERPITLDDRKYSDVFYIPIYSDIYVDQQNQNTLLAATLSIRNTSYSDSLYISKIDYFNTEGSLVRSYIDNLINIPPMGTLNYVIEKEDDSGGPGANFIVEVFSENPNAKPLIQAVMIGETGNKAFSFSTDAYSVGDGSK